MIRDPKDLQRYTAAERSNHMVIGIAFVLLALSGLAFFHPAFFPLAQLFGGPVWTRILHPYAGVVMALSFAALFFRFRAANKMTAADRQWLSQVGQMVDGDDHNMPEQGKFNGGQKLMFWVLAVCMLLMTASGLVIWRAWFDLDPALVRLAFVVHAATAAVSIALVMVHVYVAIWVTGTTRAMWYGTVTRAWARQHHRGWYRQMTGK